eukprot:scaffold64204_cov24-Tisochrysis_lutea.AAC.1
MPSPPCAHTLSSHAHSLAMQHTTDMPNVLLVSCGEASCFAHHFCACPQLTCTLSCIAIHHRLTQRVACELRRGWRGARLAHICAAPASAARKWYNRCVQAQRTCKLGAQLVTCKLVFALKMEKGSKNMVWQ